MLTLTARGEAVHFAGLVLAMALGLSLMPGGGAALYGWTPFLAVALILVLTGKARSRSAWAALGFGSSGRRLWLIAIAIPIVVLSTGYVVAAAGGVTGLALPAGVSVPRFVITWLVLLPAGAISAIGEELGWRGFLVPRLASLGRVRTGLAIGLLWAVWHYPLILISGAYHGGADLPFLALFTATVVAITFISNELRMATTSAWPSTILHGAHNASWDQLRSLVTRPSGSLDLVAGEAGLVPLLLYGAVAVWIIVTRRDWLETRSQASTGVG
jgi:membrane protease YdiL (CAAX protease family)